MQQMTYQMNVDHLVYVGDPALGLQSCTLCQTAVQEGQLHFDIPSLTLCCGRHSSEEFMQACNERVLDAVYGRTAADKQAEQEMAEAAKQENDISLLSELYSKA